VVRHRDEIDALGDSGSVAESLEDRQCLGVVWKAGVRVVEIRVPIANAIQAPRHERLIA
jgi:hypothetical protein